MRVTRQMAAKRAITGRCPNCGQQGIFARPFHLPPECPHCGLPLNREHGFTLGTTSVGYVLALIFILAPCLYFVMSGALSVTLGVILGVVLSIIFPIITYPFLVRCVVALYFYSLAHELPANTGKEFDVGDQFDQRKDS